MEFLAGVFIIIVLGIVADTAVKIAKLRAGGKDAQRLRSEVTDLTSRLDEHATGLADAHAALASQEAQIQELQERVDFAERMLAQSRDRPGLGAGPSPS